MSYFSIENLYKNQKILMMKEVYALEKIHGSSSHITFKSGRITFFAGGGEEWAKFEKGEPVKLWLSAKIVERM